jgi:hypothetical protein
MRRYVLAAFTWAATLAAAWMGVHPILAAATVRSIVDGGRALGGAALQRATAVGRPAGAGSQRAALHEVVMALKNRGSCRPIVHASRGAAHRAFRRSSPARYRRDRRRPAISPMR